MIYRNEAIKKFLTSNILSKIGPEVVGLVKSGSVDKVLIVEPPPAVVAVDAEVAGDDDDNVSFLSFRQV